MSTVTIERANHNRQLPEGWRWVALGEVCQIIAGQSPVSETYRKTPGGLPFFQGKTDFGELYPKIRVFCNRPSRIAEQGDILMSVRAPVGPTNLAKEKCCIGRGLAAAHSKPSSVTTLNHSKSRSLHWPSRNVLWRS